MQRLYQTNSEKFFRIRAELFGPFLETTFQLSMINVESLEKTTGLLLFRLVWKGEIAPVMESGEIKRLGKRVGWLISFLHVIADSHVEQSGHSIRVRMCIRRVW